MSASPFDGEYEPPSQGWVRKQVERYEASGGTEANTLMDTGIPIIVMTTVGARSGKVRKVPLMRVEHGGEYALVASKGGTPENPGWYHNLTSMPRVRIQDGATPREYDVTELSGDERQAWWDRAVAQFPPYGEYQHKTARTIPVFKATPRA
ncbi:MAG: nitroreductase family deazaflavin-dependent oxidoreductase [Thermoleophilia bacterium]|nr:nitroreductase family deazaflavin-dependent oxidoreductase [Thermoleophilia bacterium]